MSEKAAKKMPAAGEQRIRLLSYNIQSGLQTASPREYITKGWKHFFPHPEKQENLDLISKLVVDFDIVGLQEVDAGSLRSSFLDQTAYLAHRADFPYWNKQVNRNVGPLAQYSNGFLSRIRPMETHTYSLPGLPGRGAILVDYGEGDEQFSVVFLHLALSRHGRLRQLSFVSDLIASRKHIAVMGDLNCPTDSGSLVDFMAKNGLKDATCGAPTYPSWQPVRKIDHIFLSDSLDTDTPHVIDFPLSDHLPVSVDVVLPFKLNESIPD
ncbi:endonuclease/exonuclease/phosphatase family protein [Solemya velum gill symbiont]|uniref:Metal-dependent hydrolase n=2 Tax=Solemya velum gill symbiont TaxID=2340 RepID=A0A0B0HBD8_SOVGS|nr:endonuclease/exonuclease/phosphatase family protein [Solemya velum gill symbiont]KHF25199.1 metal-dependent hydrolase [Solemya velum gill symbiont]OOY50249.1 endonuclease [Solemya velum gill symbiont]OOY54440.1 endonuclease [Solemya velum gill symbiont]OOY54857.1 endonuclease [Solemya velum gill symbiont]OOY59134.1 endonuclease [Solemya velum gill symbiont]